MSGTPSHGRAVSAWVRDIGMVVGVIASVWATGQSIVRALDWIYVDLGKQREVVSNLVEHQAEMKAVIDSHTNLLEKIDTRLEKLYEPAAAKSPR